MSIFSSHRYHQRSPKCQRGVALMIVLWMTLLLTVLASGFAYHSQVEALVARRAVDRVAGLEAARAGLELAIYQLQAPNSQLRPWADGRPYQLYFAGMPLSISIQDERGKISLNRASALQLTALFETAVDTDQAVALADGVLDFIDGDDLLRVNGAEVSTYTAAGLSHGPKNAPFVVPEELLQVYGMDYQLYQRLLPAISVYVSHASPDLRLAPKEVLSTVPGASEEFIEQFISLRDEQTLTDVPLPALPDGRQLTPTRGAGPIYTVTVEVELPNKTVSPLRVVVNVRQESGFQPYTVLGWHEE